MGRQSSKLEAAGAKGPRQVTVTFQPAGRRFTVAEGETLFEIAAEAGVEVDTVCGGNGSCGKCKVSFPGGAPEPLPVDYMHLSTGEIAEGLRLSCQVHADRDMVVDVPSSGARATVKVLHQGLDKQVELNPNVRKVYIPYTNPRQREHESDWDAVRKMLPRRLRPKGISLRLLRRLPELCRAKKGLTMTIVGRQVIALAEGNTADCQYGVALDIGSTTIVGYLMDLGTGREAAVASAVNKQNAYGDDIIGRLARAQRNPKGLEKLHRLALGQINGILGELAKSAEIEVSDICEVTVVGNMAMHHFFLALDSTYLGLAPYAPVIRESYTVPAGELDLALSPEVPVFVLPNIAGFVGSDTVAVMLATDIDSSESYRMAIDVGTNGEIALANRRRQIACSAPAGPALEGARIKMGMRAADGAIDHVTMDGDVTFTVIGGGPPVGICGSALIDIVAELRRAGLLNESGAFVRKAELAAEVPAALVERLREAKKRRDTSFVLVRAADTGAKKDIVFTQADVRECQLAKGAIRAGAMVLMDEMGITEDDLEEVQLAGAFGNFLDPKSALRAGLTPQVAVERIRPVGNAAGVGAKLALVSVLERRRAVRLARRTEHIQLSGNDKFQKAFASAMRFPELQ